MGARVARRSGRCRDAVDQLLARGASRRSGRREQPRVADRIWGLIEEIMRTPFAGTGKPEPLRFLGSGVWSRRITQEHRLVYLVRDERIDLLQARYHYGDG